MILPITTCQIQSVFIVSVCRSVVVVSSVVLYLSEPFAYIGAAQLRHALYVMHVCHAAAVSAKRSGGGLVVVVLVVVLVVSLPVPVVMVVVVFAPHFTRSCASIGSRLLKLFLQWLFLSLFQVLPPLLFPARIGVIGGAVALATSTSRGVTAASLVGAGFCCSARHASAWPGAGLLLEHRPLVLWTPAGKRPGENPAR